MPEQRQDSLDDQMRDVMHAAVEMGCYDAHDWMLRFYKRSVLVHSDVPASTATHTSTEGDR